jgi:Flp pilus assembly protein TadB
LIIGFVVWGNLPTPTMIVGAAIVTLTGLYLLRAESRRRQPLQRAAEQMPAGSAKGVPERMSTKADAPLR